MRKILKSIFTALCAGLFAVATQVNAQAPVPVKIRFTLDWIVQGQHAPFLLAKTRGYFEQEGLDVTIDAGNGSAGTLQRLAGGAYDVGFADISSFIEFLGNNPQTPRMQAVYMVHERNPNMLFALKKSGINKPTDLKGKKISGPVFSSTRKTWPLFAKATGLDVNSVTWQNVAPDLVEQAAVRGDVDLGSGFPTQAQIYYRLGVKPEDLVMIRYADYGVDLYGNTLLATSKLIAENPQALTRFLRALNRGMKDTIADPAAATKAVIARNNLLNEADELEKLKLILEFVDTANTRSDGLGSIRKLRLENQVDDIYSAYGLKSKPSADLIFNSSFLPARSERQYKK